jgi:hypothetical protein
MTPVNCFSHMIATICVNARKFVAGNLRLFRLQTVHTIVYLCLVTHERILLELSMKSPTYDEIRGNISRKNESQNEMSIFRSGTLSTVP